MRPITFPRKLMEACAKQRPAGYLDKLRPALVGETPTSLTYDADSEAYKAASREFQHKYDTEALGVPRVAVGPKIEPVRAVPREQWPRAARALATLAKPGDKGLGDVATRLIGHLGGEAFKRLFKKVTGRDCQCGDRAARLNVLYPL